MSNISMMPLHTFELSIIITAEEYQNCRNILYAVAKEMNVQCFDENVQEQGASWGSCEIAGQSLYSSWKYRSNRIILAHEKKAKKYRPLS